MIIINKPFQLLKFTNFLINHFNFSSKFLWFTFQFELKFRTVKIVVVCTFLVYQKPTCRYTYYITSASHNPQKISDVLEKFLYQKMVEQDSEDYRISEWYV